MLKRGTWFFVATVVAIILVVLVLLKQRSSVNTDNSEGSQISSTQSKRRNFHIACNEWVGFAPFLLAKEKGYFGDLDVDVSFVALEGDKRAGLYAGRFDMICETMDMFQSNRDKVPYQGKIVFALDESYGGDGIISKLDIKTVDQLKKRTIVAEPGQPAYFLLQYALYQKNMTVHDINLQDMGSAESAAAFIAGKVDAAGTYEPYLTQALKKRKPSHILLSSKDMPGVIVDVAVVKEEMLQQHRQDVETIYKGWCHAMQQLSQDRSGSVTVMAKPFKLTPAEFEESAAGLRYYNQRRNEELFKIGNSQSSIYPVFTKVGEILIKNGTTKAVDKPEVKIDKSIVIP